LKALYIPPSGDRSHAATLEIGAFRTSTYPDHAVSLAVKGGEILGLAGLVGSGRTELARAIFGIDPLLGGALKLNGEPIRIREPREAIDRGIFLVPEDRKRAGLLLDVSVAGNISLPDLRSYARGVIVRKESEVENAERQKKRLNIKTPSVATEV